VVAWCTGSADAGEGPDEAGIHPALERAMGIKVSHPAVLKILSRCGGPAGIAKVHAPRIGERLAESIMTALGEQTGFGIPLSSCANIGPALRLTVSRW
jgi:hypothetical protein